MRKNNKQMFERNWELFSTLVKSRLVELRDGNCLNGNRIQEAFSIAAEFWDSNYSEGGMWLKSLECEDSALAEKIRCAVFGGATSFVVTKNVAPLKKYKFGLVALVVIVIACMVAITGYQGGWIVAFVASNLCLPRCAAAMIIISVVVGLLVNFALNTVIKIVEKNRAQNLYDKCVGELNSMGSRIAHEIQCQ